MPLNDSTHLLADRMETAHAHFGGVDKSEATWSRGRGIYGHIADEKAAVYKEGSEANKAVSRRDRGDLNF